MGRMTSLQGITPTAEDRGSKLGLLYLTLPVANLAIMFLWMTVSAFVLPVHVQRITGTNDVATLGPANSIGPLMATIANPIFGRISDRTRSRFGRRAPWIVICVLVGSLALVAQSYAGSVLMLGISWAAVQTIMNGYQAAVTAIMPDRVPASRYGTFSALFGIGTPVAVIIGASMFIAIPELAQGGGYFVAIGVLLVAASLIVFGSPDKSSLDMAPETAQSFGAKAVQSSGAKAFLMSFVIPLKNHNFRW